MAAGEALLEKGAVSHNHFWFRRLAIERALLDEDWSEAERHADALRLRMADEPLAYASCMAARGQVLARRGRGDATEADERTLEQALAVAASADMRVETALAQRRGQHSPPRIGADVLPDLTEADLEKIGVPQRTRERRFERDERSLASQRSEHREDRRDDCRYRRNHRAPKLNPRLQSFAPISPPNFGHQLIAFENAAA